MFLAGPNIATDNLRGGSWMMTRWRPAVPRQEADHPDFSGKVVVFYLANAPRDSRKRRSHGVRRVPPSSGAGGF